MKYLPTYKTLLYPLQHIDKKNLLFLGMLELIFIVLMWNFYAPALYPRPTLVINEFINTLISATFMDDLFATLWLTIRAMFFSIMLAMLFSYGYKIAFMRPITEFIIKCRFLTLSGLIFIFTMVSSDADSLKICLLVFGIVPFFVTSFVSYIKAINVQEFQLCYTLRYSYWQTLYEIVIIGRLNLVLEIIRQNFAVCFLMITMVEGLNMSGGGLGTTLIIYSKYLNLGKMFAIMFVIFFIGVLSDMLLSWVRVTLFPHLRFESNE